jgi:hypothetical protein
LQAEPGCCEENEIEEVPAEHASYDGQVNKPFQKADDGESRRTDDGLATMNDHQSRNKVADAAARL